MEFNLSKVTKTVGTKISTLAGMKGLDLKENAPKLYGIGGAVFMGGAIIFAVMAGRKHDDVIEDHNNRVEKAKAPVNTETGEAVDQKIIAKNVRHEYCRTAVTLVRLYAPTAACTAISAVLFAKMHNSQARTISGLTGAYTGLQEYIRRYEDRNIELNGEDSHKMCKYGYKEIEVEEEDPDNGEKYKVKKKVPLEASEIIESDFDGDTYFHDHMYLFSRQTSTLYKGQKFYDLMALDQAERWLNDLLQRRGWVIVNDVLDQLGMERTDEGRNEGWVKGCGGRLELGHREFINADFLAGKPNAEILLDFNIHGNVNALRKGMKSKKVVEV